MHKYPNLVDSNSHTQLGTKVGIYIHVHVHVHLDLRIQSNGYIVINYVLVHIN